MKHFKHRFGRPPFGFDKSNPIVAISAWAFIFSVGIVIAPPIVTRVKRLPSVPFNDSIKFLVSQTSRLFPYFGENGIRHFTWYTSTAAYFLACTIVIVVSRRNPKYRDLATFAVGSAWVMLVVGVPYTVGMFCLTAIIHFFLRNVNSHLAMAFVVAMIVIVYKFFVSESEIFSNVGADSLSSYSKRVAWGCMASGALRVIVYAFEVSSVHPASRSFVTALAHSPLGLFLWPGDPLMTSYLVYSTQTDQQELDERGAMQLYRSGFKFLISIAMYATILPVMRSGSFSGGPFYIYLIDFAAPIFLVYLNISCTADFVSGLSCYAGYNAIDAYRSPFLARNPIEFWQHWNIPMVSFLRRSCAYPIAKFRRSLVLTIVSCMLGVALLHVLLFTLTRNPSIKPGPMLATFKTELSHYGTTGIFLLIGGLYYSRMKSMKRPALMAAFIFTQLLMMWTVSGLLRVDGKKSVHSVQPASKQIFGH